MYVGLGQTPGDVSAGSLNPNPAGAALTCQQCRDLGGTAIFHTDCWPTFGSPCPMITTAFIQGAASTMPPDQTTIDSQTPDDTVNQILSDQQTAAVAAATAAASQQATTSWDWPSLSSLNLNLPGLPTINWWLVGGIGVAVLVFMKMGGRR